MKRIEELGKLMSNVLHNNYDDAGTRATIQTINEELARLAKEVTGVRADQLSDDNLENKPIVLLYWTTLAQLTQMMFVSAAQQQTYYKECDK